MDKRRSLNNYSSLIKVFFVFVFFSIHFSHNHNRRKIMFRSMKSLGALCYNSECKFTYYFSALKILQGFSLNFINQIARTLERAVDKLLNVFQC